MTRYSMKLILLSAAATLALAACRDEGRQAQIDVPDATPPMYLADNLGLPYAPSAPVAWRAPDEGYRWAERAYAQQAAFYEAPPSYGFYDDGVEPWVWETADDWAMYAEPWDDGYRYYYYEPDAPYPYFVRDDDYGYGFDAAGVLISVITAGGAYLPAERLYEFAPTAGRYYVRGRDLRNRSREAQRIVVDAGAWQARAPRIERSAQPWIEAARRDDGWRAWRDRHGQEESRRFVRAETRALAAAPAIRADNRDLARDGRQAERREDRRFAQQARQAERRDARALAQSARQDDRGPPAASRGGEGRQARSFAQETRRMDRGPTPDPQRKARQHQQQQARAERDAARSAEANARQAAAQERQGRGRPDRGDHGPPPAAAAPQNNGGGQPPHNQGKGGGPRGPQAQDGGGQGHGQGGGHGKGGGKKD